MNNQRTLVLLELPIRNLVRSLAKREGVSVSALCRDLIHRGLELVEDKYYDVIASTRDTGFNWNKNGLSHKKAWGKK